MKKLKEKYAKLLLQCLCLEEKDYLFVRLPNYLSDFKKYLEEAASEYALKGIYFDVTDPLKKHELMKHLDQENINKHPFFDHSIYNKYAKLDAAFLFIQSMIPDLMNDIEPKKIKETARYIRSTEEYFRKLYEADKLNWCIAGVPNEVWAKKGLNMEVDDLWRLIFKVCLIDEKNDPYVKWQQKLDQIDETAKKLTHYNFEYLQYKNKLGTDLKVFLPKNYCFASGKDKFGRIVNMPTEEVFSSPQYDKVEGIVYASKPLFYNNIMIEDFYLEFKEGKVVSYDASSGKEILKNIIETDETSCYLGECALVSYNSSISNTGVLFKETLYDENAACHLALGRGFAECVQTKLKGEDLRSVGINESKTHVDFMIGTDDLEVIGVTYDGMEVTIMKEGNLVL